MKSLLIDAQYLPPVRYFALLLGFEGILLEREEHFVKATYRNRCVVLTASGPQMLSIPLQGGRSHHQPYKEVKIAYQENWQRYHWRSMETAYRNSPFFEFYEPYLRPFYTERHELLFDYNVAMFKMVCKLLKLPINLQFTSQYDVEPTSGISDFRSAVHPNPDKDGSGALVKPCAYYQVFADRYGFEPNVSIVDLLFNEGPAALAVLKTWQANKM